jgi:Family of unknown function (DUF6069)
MTFSKPARRATVVLAVAVLALVVWLILHAILGTLKVRSGGSTQSVTAVSVVLVAILAGLLAWALLAGLERGTGRARTIFTTVAAIVLVLSLLGPLGGASAGDKVALLVLHLTVGLPLILVLPRPSVAAQ